MPFSIASYDVHANPPIYDLVIVALGFESRSETVAESLGISGRRQIAIGFPDRQVLSFNKNSEVLAKLGYEIAVVTDVQFRPILRKYSRFAARLIEEQIRICVDISSFSRYKLAVILQYLNAALENKTALVHFVYNIAEFSSPPEDVLSVNAFAGPVTADFAGWSPNPELPPVALVGLGYEEGKALGAVEYLQADEMWLFHPTSPIPQYTPALIKANELLLANCPQSRIIKYDVGDSQGLFLRLEALAFALKAESRPLILPFGPKIFTLVGLLVAALLMIEVAVWRVSAGEGEEPADRQPSRFLVGLELQYKETRIRKAASNVEGAQQDQ